MESNSIIFSARKLYPEPSSLWKIAIFDPNVLSVE